MENKHILKSPTRENLFRACKSPIKITSSSQTRRKLSDHGFNIFRMESKEKKKIKRRSVAGEKYVKELAKGLLDKFPEIGENFDIVRKVGEGTFSKVYLAKFKENADHMFALKHLVPTSSPGRIENELKCLQVLGGVHNVLSVKTVLRKDDHIVFVLPYFPHKRFPDTIQRMTVEDIRNYMRNLIIALRHVHFHQIIHRDVKPSNFLYSREQNKYCLIDFGLAMPVPGSKDSLLKDYSSFAAQRSNAILAGAKLKPLNQCKHPTKDICTLCKSRTRQSAPRAGTPGFRSPEVLMRYPKQTTAVDMWSAGVVLLCMLSNRYPFFKAKDDIEALAQLVSLFGAKKMKAMAQSIGKDFICSPEPEHFDDLKTLCKNLSKNRICEQHRSSISDSENTRRSSKRKRNNDDIIELNTKRSVHIKTEDTITNTKKPAHSKTDLNHTEIDSKRPTDNETEKFIISDESSISSHNIRKTNTSIRTSNSSERSRTSSTGKCNCLPDSSYDLLERLLDLNPHTRINAEEALLHPFIVDS